MMMDDGYYSTLGLFFTYIGVSSGLDRWVGGWYGLDHFLLHCEGVGWVGWVAKFDIRGIAFGTSCLLFFS